MEKKRICLATGIVLISLLAGCEKKETSIDTVTVTEITTESETTQAILDEAQIATGSELASATDVVEDWMTPIYAGSINDGEYDIQVDSSSSMFRITSCKLTVSQGTMTAVMTMGGTGYRYVFMGTPEAAVKADEDSYIPYVEDNNGAHTFTVPVEALDEGIPCAAFSNKKEKWYERTLVFRSDSLPSDALKETAMTTIEDLELVDGTYTVEAVLAGGSGRASVESPAEMVVENGEVTATIVMSSENYDYMIVGEEKYFPVNTEGNSTFEIPVMGFDYNMPVKADTTAMSEPHEIDYTLYFDSKTIK